MPQTPEPTSPAVPAVPADLAGPVVPRQRSHVATLDPSAVQRLRDGVAGQVLVAGTDPDDEIARECATWNLNTRHRPAVVVGATGADDVVAAVRFAASEALPLAVQGSSHGASAAFVDGVLVNTSRMRDVTVDPVSRTARVGAGAVWSQVIEAAAPHGLAPLSGSSSGVGVVGYTLGGGMGLMARKHGFAADHVRHLEVVTADGRLRQVDADRERDLYWAVRGGKGAFGIVTSLEIDLMAVEEFTAGAIVFPGHTAAAVLHAWRQWAPTLPEETGTSVALMRLPDAPMVPEPLRGVLSVHVRVTHLGSQAQADELLAPLRACATAMVDDVATRPFTEADVVHRDPVDPLPYWERGMTLTQLPADAVDTLLTLAGPGVDIPLILVELRLMGGALAREADPPNAVSGRDSAFSLLTLGPIVPGLEQAVPATGGGVLDAMEPWRAASTVTNWLGDVVDRQQVSASWPLGHEARLRATKTILDPLDLFSHGHSVLPSVTLAERAEGEDGVLPGRYWDVEQCRWLPGPRARATGWTP